MVISGAERTKKSRLNKAISDFSNNFLEGETKVTASDFIEAKEFEFCAKLGVSSVQFDQGFINAFIDEIDTQLEEHDNKSYLVSDLFNIWRELDK